MAKRRADMPEACAWISGNFPEPLLVLDEEGMVIGASGVAESFLRLQPKDLVGKSLFKLPMFPESSVLSLQKTVHDALKNGRNESVEVAVMLDGAEASVRCSFGFAKEGFRERLLLVLHDVTDVRRVCEALTESEGRYRELFDNMQSGVAVYQAEHEGKDFIVTDFNRAAERSDRLKRSEVIGRRITEIFPGAAKIGFLDVLRRVWKTGKPEHFPPTVYEDDRLGKVWWEDHLYRLPSGEVVAAFANITERMRAKEDLRKSMKQVMEERDKIRTIVQSIADAVFVVDDKYKIVLFNRTAALLSGYTEQEALGKRYDEVLRFVYEKDERKAHVIAEHGTCIDFPTSSDNYVLLVNREGDRIPIAYSAATLHGGGGMSGVVVVFRNIAKEREVDRMKTEFVSMASQQLHSPLAGVKWFLDIMLRGKAGPLSEEQRKYLEQVYAGNERMVRLVEQLMSVLRIETGEELEINKSPADVVRIIDGVIEENVDLIKEFRVTVEKSEGMPNQLTLNVDQEKIRRVFYNLISNAVKYSKPLGKVEVGYDPGRADAALFYVKDYGYGIPKRQQHRIFEKFFRADNVVTRVTAGTGLGLYIVKAIVEAHGGKVWFTSAENMGSTFFFTIPKGVQKKRRRSGVTPRSASGGKA
jgi:PAS domain S-box-containing protein